ncbi:MAG TPA: hypothetical protein VL336_09920 [Sphingomicrobium sp.]|jgi:hypothetical protein|nr:hypothetical protein [Sphingomicrobium sp.]
MFATFVTLAVISFALTGLRNLARQDGAKIIAALQGRSWTAEPMPAHPAIVRLNPRYRAAEPTGQALRAAA